MTELKVNAIQWTNYRSSGMADVPHIVGYFPIPEGTPPFTPVEVALVATSLERAPSHKTAWVAHNGAGMVLGDFEPDMQYFGDPQEYLAVNDCESDLPV